MQPMEKEEIPRRRIAKISCPSMDTFPTGRERRDALHRLSLVAENA